MEAASQLKLGTGGNLNAAPAGFSYTFRGYKGVHGVNPQLDVFQVIDVDSFDLLITYCCRNGPSNQKSIFSS